MAAEINKIELELTDLTERLASLTDDLDKLATVLRKQRDAIVNDSIAEEFYLNVTRLEGTRTTIKDLLKRGR